ncbi:dihydrofolate reductase family protein [Phytohabitans aurantiacus]|uniref:Deaminase reductase n=1 Tax=Phytohabitans aurantiacus TaxID=3016789 RepID=A0ABQ5R2C6_9ACTN|nr:dihydrofolate reductase family protein [Phytohabitans aurantiacus]GLI00580.1 deaminase reductase [Phytohabitans aurantiacus]
MRLTVTTFVTLDGVVQSPYEPDEDPRGGFDLGGWLPGYVDGAVGGLVAELVDRADAFLLGRRTYDGMAAHWPYITDPADRVAGAFNRLPKYVATTRDDELAWPGARRLVGTVGAAVADLKTRPGRELQVHGSGTLARSLMAEGLVDGYHLLIVPVVLGHGRRLFARGVPPARYRLMDSRTSGSGVTVQTYQHAGAPVFGWAATTAPHSGRTGE